jgi:hypothetical protein
LKKLKTENNLEDFDKEIYGIRVENNFKKQ